MSDVYSSNKAYNPREKKKVLIVFDYMVADMISNKKGFTQYSQSCSIKGRKFNSLLVFIIELYFQVPKDARLNTSNFFVMKIPNKQ